MIKVFRILAACALFLALVPTASSPEESVLRVTARLEAISRPTGDFAAGEVLVRWRNEVNVEALEALNAEVVERIADERTTLLEVTEGSERSAVHYLASLPDVEWAQPNYLRRTQLAANDPLYAQQWGLQRIQAPTAWDITTGQSSVIVAVVDTGVDLKHPDLQGKLVTGRNVVQPEVVPQDDGGHGTHVAGTIAATINNSIGVAGVASGVSIMPIKVLKSDGVGRDSNVASGVRWAIDNGARIINMSFTGTEVSPVLTDAVSYAASRNVVVVVAAGNDGSSTPTYPAATKPTISVGATDTADHRAYFSNYGDWVDLGAPGQGILSTYWDNASTYRADSGTSMAAPHVTGVIALLLSIRPGLTIAEIVDTLKSTADRLPDTGLGAGRVNAARAVSSLVIQDTPVPTVATPTVLPTITTTATATLQPTPAPSLTPQRAVAATYNAPAAATQVHLPAVLSNVGGWNTQITVQNASANVSNVVVRFISESGAMAGTTTFVLRGYGATGISVEGTGAEPWRGSAIVSADNPLGVVALLTRASTDDMSYEGIPLGSTVSSGPLVFKGRNGWNTSLAVQNLSIEVAAVELVYTSSTGLLGSWTESATIPGLASRYFAATVVPEDFVGSVLVRSARGQPIAVVLMNVNEAGDASAYGAVLPSNSSLVAPLLFKNRTTNGTWNSGIQLQNLGTEPARLTVVYRSSDGPAVVMAEAITIAAGASRTLYQPANPSLPDEFVGSATITVENGQMVTGLVNQVNYDRHVSTGYGLLTGGDSGLLAPFMVKGVDRRNASIQVVNRGQVLSAVSITLRNQGGATVAAQQELLDAGAARTIYLPAIASLSDNLVGSAIVATANGSPLSAIVNLVAY